MLTMVSMHPVMLAHGHDGVSARACVQVAILSTCVARSKESNSSVEPEGAVGSSKRENAVVS